MKLKTVFTPIVLVMLFWAFGHGQSKQNWQEEQEDYYKKWLKEDVVYIITEEEENIFRVATTMPFRNNARKKFDMHPNHLQV